jgi:hypothetical protein
MSHAAIDPVEVIARTLLYEGYLLYPYRPSALKNQQRFNFGVLYPYDYREVQSGAETSRMQMQCLLLGDDESAVDVSVRFLQLFTHASDGAAPSRQEATERDLTLRGLRLGDLRQTPATVRAEFCALDVTETTGARTPQVPAGSVAPAEREIIRGELRISAETIQPVGFRLTVQVANLTSMAGAQDTSAAAAVATVAASASVDRDAALLRSFVSTHIAVTVLGGECVSLLDPPDAFREAAAGCRNIGVWPVLVGEEPRRDRLLASPIILYDYPQIAPESQGDLFDGTEIDEILALRILTMTDDEKREIRAADDRGRHILERTEALPEEQWRKLHGAVRGLRRVTGGTP